MRHAITAAVLIAAVSMLLLPGCAKKTEKPPDAATVNANPGTAVGNNGASGETGRVSLVAFSSRVYKDRGVSRHDIFLLEPGASAARRLTADEANNTRPAWSPDGSRLAYMSESAEGVDICVRNTGDNAAKRITASPMKITPQILASTQKKLTVLARRIE